MYCLTMGDSVTCSPVVFWLVSIVRVQRKAHILCTLSVLRKNTKVKVTKYPAAKPLFDVEQKLTTQLHLTVHQCTYHSSGNFVFRKFVQLILYWNIFVAWGNHENKLPWKCMYIHWENRGLWKGSLCSWLSRLSWHLGGGCCVHPYVSAIVWLVPPLPYLDVLLCCCLHFSIRPTIPWAGIADESEFFGSCKPSLCCRYCNRAIYTHTQLFAWPYCLYVRTLHSVLFVVKNILWQIFNVNN